MRSAGTMGHRRGCRDHRTDDTDRASPIGAAWSESPVLGPLLQQPVATMRWYSPATSGSSSSSTANSLPSFALWSAFPTSDYYEGSVPLPSHQMTTLLPCLDSSIRHEGDSIAVPTFTTHRLTGVGSSFSPAASL